MKFGREMCPCKTPVAFQRFALALPCRRAERIAFFYILSGASCDEDATPSFVSLIGALENLKSGDLFRNASFWSTSASAFSAKTDVMRGVEEEPVCIQIEIPENCSTVCKNYEGGGMF